MKRADAKTSWLATGYRVIKSADSSTPPGKYMMMIASIDRTDHQRTEVYAYQGDIYAVKGEGGWPTSYFLGNNELHPAGTGTWISPLYGNMVIGCPLEEDGDPNEWGFSTA